MNKSIYYRQPYQEILIKEVKEPLKEAVDILTGRYGIVKKTRALWLLRNVMYAVTNKLPEPTLEVVKKPGARTLVSISNRFFRRLHLPGAERYLRPIVKLAIVIYDTDLYDQWINWWVWELKKSDWPALRSMEPDPHFFYQEEKE